MTDERDKSASVVDETVSQVYRETAGEKAPEHLDRKILQQAATAARPRYARSRAWTRPLAWAATIALSVAIVLELNRVPAPETGMFDADTAAFDDGAADVPADVPAVPAEEVATAEFVPGRSADVTPRAPEKSAVMQKTAAPVAIEADAAERERQVAGQESGVEPAAAASGAAGFEMKDEEILQRADEMAEMQFANTREGFIATEPTARPEAAALASAAEPCPEEARRDPEAWLECIDALEEAGLEPQAEEQRRLLRETFPTFELP